MIKITNTYSGYHEVEYLGSSIIVPWWAKYIATNSNGHVYIFVCEPYYDKDIGIWLNSNPDYSAEHIAIGILSINPKDSMVKL